MKSKALKSLLVVSSLFLATGALVACENGRNGSQSVVEGEHFTGIGEPPAGLGVDGDTYTDTSTGETYKKTGGKWVKQGESGVKKYTGQGEPSADLGKDGDIYINTLNNAEYTKQGGVWVLTKAGETTFVVTFNLNGGHFSNGQTTYPDQIVMDGRWVSAPAMNPTKEHCTFLGWFPEGSNEEWNFFSPVRGNLNLVAQYRVNTEDKIVVKVNPNNGEENYDYETFIGDYFYPSIPSKDGYNFLGWYIQSTDERYTGYVTSDCAGQTLIAKWEKGHFNVSYQIEASGEVTITGLLDINTVSIAIPNEISGRKVTRISSSAFNSRVYLESVTIPANVKVVEPGAFRGTFRLAQILVDSGNTNYVSVDGVLYTKDMTELVCYPTKVGGAFTCPGTLKKIGDYAFYDSKDSGITGITFNEGLEEIGVAAFYMNETISTLQFPSTLKKIGAKAFYGPSFGDDTDTGYISPQGVIQVVYFNDGLEEIGEMAFVNQYFKNTFTLPASVKVIGDYCFANCTAIEKLIIPANLETLGRNAFSGCTGIMEVGVAEGCKNFTAIDGLLYNKAVTKLVMCPSGRTEQVVIPEGVTELGDYAFYMVDQLNDYVFPSTLTKIGNECFAQTYELRELTIPNSVTEIGQLCFYESGIKTVTLGSGLQNIAQEAFYGCGLTSVTIPASVRTIGKEAFAGNSRLTSVTFNEGITEIGDSAFYGSKLTSLEMPNSLQKIGNNAFYGSTITALNIKDGLTDLGISAFSTDSGTAINTISVSSGNTKFSTADGVLYSKDGSTLYFASSRAGTESGDDYVVTIRNGVKVINDYAFAYNKKITVMNFPTTLETIGEGALMYSHLNEINIPSSVKKICDGAFYFSYADAVNFSEGLEEIGDSAFAMSDIVSVTLPNSLKKVGESAFARCMSLKSMTLGNGLEEICDFAFSDNKVASKIVIPATCTQIGKGAFSSTVSTYGSSISEFEVDAANPNYSTDGTLLMNKDQTVVYAIKGSATSIELPSTIKEIAPYGLAHNQVRATSLALPNSLETIGECGLAFLTRVSAITIPSSVTYIGEYAFAYWGLNQVITFSCSRDSALTNFNKGFLYSCSAKTNFVGEE